MIHFIVDFIAPLWFILWSFYCLFVFLLHCHLLLLVMVY